MAPEILNGQGQDYAVDVWALGILLYDLLAGFNPWYKAEGDLERVKNLVRNVDYICPPWFSPDASDLVRKILVLDRSKRFSPSQILAHPLLSQHYHARKKFFEANPHTFNPLQTPSPRTNTNGEVVPSPRALSQCEPSEIQKLSTSDDEVHENSKSYQIYEKSALLKR